MYLEFYGLSEKPFSQTPDPRFLYWNDAYRETLASLSYGIRERKGFIAMLGEAGTGKTTLLRKLLDDLGDDIVSVFLFNPNATFEEILEYTLSELGITAPSGRKLQMLQRLNEFLLAAYSEGRNTILIIDEAQDLDSDVLESLRLLSNLETAEDKILQIVLSGQPEFAEKLADPGLRQLKQRISVRCRLEPLQRDELPDFLSARLAVAGGSPDLFDPETFDTIWTFTSGIPRIINSVCDNALLLGYALGKRTIDAGVMQEVITDLRKIDVDSWLPTAAPGEPDIAVPAESPAAPPPQQAQIQPAPMSEPAPRGSGRPPNGANSLGWMVAAVLASLVLPLRRSLAGPGRNRWDLHAGEPRGRRDGCSYRCRRRHPHRNGHRGNRRPRQSEGGASDRSRGGCRGASIGPPRRRRRLAVPRGRRGPGPHERLRLGHTRRDAFGPRRTRRLGGGASRGARGAGAGAGTRAGTRSRRSQNEHARRPPRATRGIHPSRSP